MGGLALVPGLWSRLRGGVLSGGSGAGKAKGWQGQGSWGRSVSCRLAGRVQGSSRAGLGGGAGICMRHTGRRAGPRGQCGQGGPEARGPDGGVLFERTKGRRERGGGERTPEFVRLRPFFAGPRRNGLIPGWTSYRAGTRDPGCADADLLHAAEQADGHSARSLRPTCDLQSPVCSLGSPLKQKVHFCAANKHVTPSSEGPVQAAAYLCGLVLGLFVQLSRSRHFCRGHYCIF